MKEDKPMSYYEKLFQHDPETLKLYKRNVAMKKVFGEKIVNCYENDKCLFVVVGVVVLFIVVFVIVFFYNPELALLMLEAFCDGIGN